MAGRKLIEVALPLEAINRESAREKSIRHGHPSTLHLWWARRPLAAARAVLFAQLVDDPSARPEEFPTEEDQRRERERLHELIERLVVWENTRDEKLLAEAHAEILKSTNGNPPPILDPFAGGGTIPLEAQRLGLEAHASDLNPVAVLINKALIEIPPKFANRPPVFPGLADTKQDWRGAEGLAADVRAYGQWMRDEAEKRIGHLYPKAQLPDGTEAPVIAWIWARTVRCPNPACGIEMPLVRSWNIGTKKGNEARVVPRIVEEPGDVSNKRVQYAVQHGTGSNSSGGTMSGRQGAICISCNGFVSKNHIKEESVKGNMRQHLICVVAESLRRRIYLSPTSSHEVSARIEAPVGLPDQELGYDPRNLWTPQYGLVRFTDLFTERQLVVLATLTDLVGESMELVLEHSRKAAKSLSNEYKPGVPDPENYASAIATYLGLGVSRTTDVGNSLVTWSNSRNQARNLFARQAIPMAWDFVEVFPFAGAAGDVSIATASISKVLAAGPIDPKRGGVGLQPAESVRKEGFALSTDPPYYDNISYSDLSDFFYVWLRLSLGSVHPELFRTLVAPKSQELVANPYRHGGKQAAKQFFENGFRDIFRQVREQAVDGFPMTVYYAFKQSESSVEGESSSGWETLLEGMIGSGWVITATWPLRSERGSRTIAVGTNALASSIVLALRSRSEEAKTIDRRTFISLLRQELPDALRTLQQGAIAPVDLPQAAIGPGMAVFSRYAGVLESTGKKMTVRSALARINEILDEVLNEQEGDFDATTRFAIAWYRQHGYGTGVFGDADNLARARNTAVDALDRDGILTSRAGKVTLIKPDDLNAAYDVLADSSTSAWEALHHLARILATDGVPAAGAFLAAALSRPDSAIDADMIKELAFLLFSIAEKNKWSADALVFNTLATSWPDLIEASRSAPVETQGRLDEED